ncbi:MAG: hypothetical protein KGY80_08465 [Candidatus Thorarchaeota archaeon]|nr:hypothetical protein [Candidatus Thorarchaeota archaeon]
MRKIDESVPELPFVVVVVCVLILGVLLQLTGLWVMMLLAGGIGALFCRSLKRAFAAGFLGVGMAWAILFAYLILTAQALAIADFFITLLGLSGLGWLVIVISIIIGALLGGFGAALVRALVELVDEMIDGRMNTEHSA